jgi:hypothetical protein
MSAIGQILVFAALASPQAFKLTSRYLGNWIASPDGMATIPGLLLHGMVFVVLMTTLFVIFGRKSDYLTEGGMRFTTRDDQDDENTGHYQRDRFVYKNRI